jgi:hypothetical protein
MRRTSIILAAGLAVLTLSSCVIAQSINKTGPIERVEPGTGLVYGHVTLPGGAGGVDMAHPRLMFAGNWRAHVYPDGDFVFENVQPGEYALRRMFLHGEYYYFAYQQLRPFEVKPGRATFAGSYEVHFEGAAAVISAVPTPTSAQILRNVSEKASGSGWDAVIRGRP